MTEPVQAAIYCRMSLARFGDATKIEDQERLCRELASQLGWNVAEVYSDNNRSAWQKNRKRPGWDAMLQAVDEGRINGIITYHGDRLVRQPEDLEKLIKLADGKGVRLASQSGTRNLAVRDDRAMLRIIATFAVNESDATSDRRKAQYDRWRLEGKVRAGGRGGRAFAFKTDGVTHIPAEAEIVRECADRILGGEAAGGIARDLTARRIKTPAGNGWTHQTLKKMLLRPRYAGLMPDGESAAGWEAVLDRRIWEATVAAIQQKAAGFTYTTNARKYLLSGIATCSVCGSGLQIRAEHRRTHQTGYGCVTPGCRKVQRSVRLLDAYVVRRVLNRLSHEANPEGNIPDAPGLAAQFSALTIARGETDAAIRDPASGIPLPSLLARLENIDQRLAELRELAAGDARHRLLATHTGITEDGFAGLPLSVRRALVAACYTVTVLPSSGRGPGFRPEDVRLTPR